MSRSYIIRQIRQADQLLTGAYSDALDEQLEYGSGKSGALSLSKYIAKAQNAVGEAYAAALPYEGKTVLDPPANLVAFTYPMAAAFSEPKTEDAEQNATGEYVNFPESEEGCFALTLTGTALVQSDNNSKFIVWTCKWTGVGKQIVLTTGPYCDFGWKLGEERLVVGTIRRKEVWNGVRQTALYRLSFPRNREMTAAYKAKKVK